MTQARRKITKEQQAGMSFPFIGEALALDLTNTDILLRGKKLDILTDVVKTRQWWREATVQHPDRYIVKDEEVTTLWNESLLTNLKCLRSTLRHLFTAIIEQRLIDKSDLEELNRVLAIGYQAVEVEMGGKLITVYQTTEPAYGAILLPIALSAMHIIVGGEQGRLHKCANERCVALFYDTTRSATRRWCSPECMNRERSLQHYREAKARKSILSVDKSLS